MSPIDNIHSLLFWQKDTLFNSEVTALKVFKLAENQLHCFHSNGNDLTFFVSKNLTLLDQKFFNLNKISEIRCVQYS